jgi:signal transduction histidine kinase/CheY-like chemotaxis protein/HPt (histidine-containing phosphotransfer) domain-containing protein
MALRLRKPSQLIDPSISWLMGIAVACLLVVFGIKLFFDNLQAELNEKSANERARLFVGEEIVRGIHGIEKDLYLMAASTNLAAVKRANNNIDQQLGKLRHDLVVLKEGGVVRRAVMLNLEGRDEMVREASYRPMLGDESYIMELIEIGPLLDQVEEKTDQLEKILLRSWELQERSDHRGFFEFHDQVDAFLKHIPPYFARLDENANRLFFDSSERLRELEGALVEQRLRLKQVEMGLMALVMILAGLIGMFFLRRINVANQKLEAAVDEMRVAKDAAERASRAKSEFVSRMSHELRTPLNAIIGFAELLEAEPLSPSHKNYVNLINSSGKHLMELINAVLDHAKIEAGGMTLEKIAFDFSATIEAVKTIVNEQASTKGLEFSTHINGELPRYVVGDPTRLRQILINLLVNAVKFTAQGSVELRIVADEGRIVFSVRDTGIGMNEVALGRLFKPFSQADDSVTRKFGGTGLGLMISKELIEAMGGSIEVESAPGVGTVFWFWLPLQAAACPVGGNEPSVLSGTKATTSMTDLVAGRVLLVDDNRVNQQLAAAMLERLGLDCDFADNGAHALQQLATTEYALVLMDMEMPEMDGVTATERYRAEEALTGKPALPIIAMTANAMQEDRERCFAAGMNGYIAKPISRAALQGELQRLFGSADTLSTVPPASTLLLSPAGSFDRAAVIEMLGDEALFNEVAAIFVTDAPGYLTELEAALAAADAPRVSRAAHTLKGLFGTFVATSSEAIASQLEQATRNGLTTESEELVKLVRVHTEALAKAMAN